MRKGLFLIERVAWMYYMEKYTQKEISNILGISRSKVVRALKEAEKLGIIMVRIKLRNEQYYPELERQFIEKFNLKDCVVIPFQEDNDPKFFPNVAAQYIEQLIEVEDVIGVAWGNTLREVFQYFNPPINLSKITVVQLLGGLAAGEPQMNPYDITRFFEGAKCVYLYAPAIVSCVETKKYLMKEPQIRRVFEMMLNVNKAFVGIGDLSQEASLLKAGFLSSDQMSLLLSKGAVGDIVGRFFDINGNLIDWEVNDRIIGITLPQFRNIPIRIGIARGKRKIRPILGALRGGHINILITDFHTASEVLKLASLL
ncbi:MAG: hypothetical protein DRJ64_09135 [Thermoprotei archaeon]|nr:MAG: hypothetical protein DRJ64_09135 [Thermoprotei archaeon]